MLEARERAEHERLRAYRQVHSLPSATPPPKRRPFMETAPHDWTPDAAPDAYLRGDVAVFGGESLEAGVEPPPDITEAERNLFRT